jgi:AraC-like DNA-binding protein
VGRPRCGLRALAAREALAGAEQAVGLAAGLEDDAISYAVGYEDPASFRRLFKRITGAAPGVYRRKLQRARRLVTR